MKYFFLSFTETPTPFRLEPAMDEVFHEPEKFVNYFKPVLAVDLAQIIPGEVGTLFFVYTTCAYNVTLEVVDGKYELRDYEDGEYVPVADPATVLDSRDIPLGEDKPISQIVVKPPYPAKPSARFVQIHPFESDLSPDDDDWYDAVEPFQEELRRQGIQIATEIGHLGGQPCWMQWVDQDTIDYVTGFVGQLTASRWGDFYGAWIYMHLDERNGRRFVSFTYQYT
jgi:hypothetical protein